MKDTPDSFDREQPFRKEAERDARGLSIAAGSPFAVALPVYADSMRAQLSELAITARIFMTIAITNLDLIGLGPEDEYEHTSISETVHRFATGFATSPTTTPPPAQTTNRASSTNSASPTDSACPTGSPVTRSSDIPRATPELPRFPAFRPKSSCNSWVHRCAEPADISEFATVRATSIARTYSHIVQAITLIHGLPRFHRRCLNGDFTTEHLITATRACKDVEFEHLPVIDEYLANRRADVSIATFKKTLDMKIAATQPTAVKQETVSSRRGVSIYTHDDGSADMFISGPAPEVQACFRRIEAFARAIHNQNTSAFGTQLNKDESFDEDRGIDALMFDILTRTMPKLSVRVTTKRSTDASATNDSATVIDQRIDNHGAIDNHSYIGSHNDAAPHSRSTCRDRETSGHDDGNTVFDIPLSGLFATGEGETEPTAASICSTLDEVSRCTRNQTRELVLHLPDAGSLLTQQAKIVVTVPALTLTRDAELPGMFADGSPVPAEVARQIAGHAATWTRILTDPATGTPLDAKSVDYTIPASVRKTLHAKYLTCTMPGCTRRAENSEIDHIVPFNRKRPEAGGRTIFTNLHPLCKKHHQAKTDRRFSVRRSDTQELEFVFRHRVSLRVHSPDNPINTAHSRTFAGLAGRHRNRDYRHLEAQPARAPDITDREFHYLGERILSTTRPGPPPHDGRPGWVEYPAFLRGVHMPGSTNPPQVRDDSSGAENSRTNWERSANWEQSARRASYGSTADYANPDLKEWFWDSGEQPPF